MATAAQVRAALRSALDDKDSPPSRAVRSENLRRNTFGDQVNGTNKFFQLNNRRFVDASLVVISDGSTLTPVTDYTTDPTRGTFTIGAGPAAPATTLEARYDWLLFLDAEIDEHTASGMRFVGYTDVTAVPDGLLEALIRYACGCAFEALAARSAGLIDASAGNKTINRKSIKDHYLALAKQKYDEAKELRDTFWTKQGQQNTPAYGKFATQQTVYTPRR